MLNADAASSGSARPGAIDLLRRLRRHDGGPATASRACDTLRGLADAIAPQRRRVPPGEVLFHEGARCKALFALNGGIVRIGAAARETTYHARYRFRGDWLGIDGVASGRHATTAIALAACDVWTLRLDALSVAGALQPVLLGALRQAVALEAARACKVHDLPLDAPIELVVADFLHEWSRSLRRQGCASARVALRVDPAELAACLGRPVQAVQGALALLVRQGAVRRGDQGHDAVVGDPDALAHFMAWRQGRLALQ